MLRLRNLIYATLVHVMVAAVKFLLSQPGIPKKEAPFSWATPMVQTMGVSTGPRTYETPI